MTERFDLACINARHGGCAGEIIFREPLVGRGPAVLRCDHHQALAVERAEKQRPA
ncbi:hypothetical protein ABT274_12345 [Streptomyces sp. NPDC001127]|uniref:hypothetical protein n=1 Tax=unclassified Streptomyces TaxID=2593676 RepID=UPI001D0FF947|nr:hypothetical protein [Streptomyces sp. ET3-23]MCC2279505.1 hypothetical protein [Streptomyces sp. ET3-23]